MNFHLKSSPVQSSRDSSALQTDRQTNKHVRMIIPNPPVPRRRQPVRRSKDLLYYTLLYYTMLYYAVCSCQQGNHSVSQRHIETCRMAEIGRVSFLILCYFRLCNLSLACHCFFICLGSIPRFGKLARVDTISYMIWRSHGSQSYEPVKNQLDPENSIIILIILIIYPGPDVFPRIFFIWMDGLYLG